MAVPSRWSESPPGRQRPAPKLGEHSVEILREAGYSDAEIEAMRRSGVTQT
jgi:crotonobetainyl-CoA:carnitine CoA-transferase CaiB-like acyl-CoA transferase